MVNSAEAAAAAASWNPTLVRLFFGSQTGKTKKLAAELEEALKTAGLAVVVSDMATYDPEVGTVEDDDDDGEKEGEEEEEEREEEKNRKLLLL